MKPMRAGKAGDVHLLSYPLYASVKLDGIRAVVEDGVVLSKKKIAIPNRHVQKLFGKAKFNGLDGELIVGATTGEFIDASAGIMRIEGTPDVRYHVFDDWRQPTAPFHMRQDALAQRVAKLADDRVVLVKQRRFKYPEELVAWEEAMLAKGHEGLMLRSVDGPYKFGTSTPREGYLLKLKRFEDSEAEVLDVEELEHNLNDKVRDNVGNAKRSGKKEGKVAGGTLGALIVRDIKSKVEFNIGSGFTAKQRAELWKIRADLIGLLAKYRYFPTGGKDKPRFPTFLGFRDRRDL